MMYAYLIKARKNAGKPNLFTWFDSKSDSRADREIMNILEDNEIETGRGADYQLPVRTDVPVFDDLPAESVLDAEWCNCYELADDARTWQKIVAAPEKAKTVPAKAETVPVVATSETALAETETVDTSSDITIPSEEQVSERLAEMRNLDDGDIIDSKNLPFNTELAHFWIGGMFTATPNERNAANAAAMDMDNSYLQNVILALNSVESCKHCFNHVRQSLLNSIKTIWPVEEKSPALNLVLAFVKEWMAGTNDASNKDSVYRTDITDKWLTRYRKERAESGATACALLPAVESNNESAQASPAPKVYKRAVAQNMANLSIEIAIAQMYPDAEPGKISRAQLIGAKEMADKNEESHAKALKVIGKTTDILDYNANSIFGVTRAISWIGEVSTKELRGQVREWLTANGIYENGERSKGYPEWDEDSRTGRASSAGNHPGEEAAAKVEVSSLGGGMFSIEGLMGSLHSDKPVINTPSNEVEKEENQPAETTSNEQMEATDGNEIAGSDEIPAGESADADNPETVAVAEAEQPETTAEFPAYFEPGRYEGLPNDAYHAANGISSTMVKDARVSLMYFHGRHIAKTIGRETSDALTFGTLVHSLALEPEAFDAEFAVFPGVPAGAFTSTDTLKAFIRDYNADKAKADQLKLTGKKEELQEAIRAVNPDAIFADEFEQQWREANQHKIILSAQQLAHAKAIQQALFNHPSAGQLLQHPNRANEVSYFGMDEETGLEVRVRPDLEIDMPGVRIGVDLKTISLGKVKQDYLRAKLHREIIERDYHLSAAMYCDVADFNQFFWIFVNKDEGYHWVAIIEASEELLELGRLEYRKAMNAISNALDTNLWPAPINADYTDELNDFDLRRLEALRLA